MGRVNSYRLGNLVDIEEGFDLTKNWARGRNFTDLENFSITEFIPFWIGVLASIVLVVLVATFGLEYFRKRRQYHHI